MDNNNYIVNDNSVMLKKKPACGTAIIAIYILQILVEKYNFVNTLLLDYTYLYMRIMKKNRYIIYKTLTDKTYCRPI